MSWTLDKDKARWFGTRLLSEHHKPPYLLEAKVERGDVLAYFTERGEDEIVLRSSAVNWLKRKAGK